MARHTQSIPIQSMSTSCWFLVVVRILGIKESPSLEVIVLGVAFKNMKLKPQVLDKYLNKGGPERELQSNKNRVREDDILYLEDEGTRTQLTGDALSIGRYVSGMCLAIKGRQLPDGKLEVLDVCPASGSMAWEYCGNCIVGYAPQVTQPRSSGDKYMVLVSGWNLTSIGPKERLSLELSMQYLSGHLSDPISQKVVHVVICGGLIGKNEDLAVGSSHSRQQLRAMEPILEADSILQEISSVVSVDVMPGLYDPATFLMPQQPMHKCLFPRAMQHQGFSRVTNPHDFAINGVQFFGTAGQNIDDILLQDGCMFVQLTVFCCRHSNHRSGLEVMDACLKHRHMAPTCPDTLTCFPFNQSDPFVMEAMPHVFFVGNQPSFQTKTIKGDGFRTRLISIPEFAKTQEVVLVHLETLDCRTVRFDAFP